MKNTRKKKNLALRRRIRKTTASLFMVVAIVVAVIPVENLKTIEAAATTYSVGSMYPSGAITPIYTPETSSPIDYTKEGDYASSTTEVLAQRIENGKFRSLLKVKIADTPGDIKEGMVTGVDKNIRVGTKLEIGMSAADREGREYYNYIRMGNKYINAVVKLFENEKYSIVFSGYPQTEVKVNNGNNVPVFPVGSDNSVYKILPTITVTKVNNSEASMTYSVTNPVASGSFLNSTDVPDSYNMYKQVKNPTDVNDVAMNLFNSYLRSSVNPNEYLIDEIQDKINEYNADADALILKIENLKSKAEGYCANASNPKFTMDDYQAWTDCVNEKTELDNRLARIKKMYTDRALNDSDLLKDGFDYDGNNLSDVVDAFIINRICYKGDTFTYLKDFTLEWLETELDNDEDVWVPKLQPDKHHLNGSQMREDDNGYLVTGMVKINGIASGAFEGNNLIGEVVLPSTVCFIGKDAFKDASILKKVTIDTKFLTVIGDSAFEGCDVLESVTFNDATSSLETIGTKAFYNTKLQSIAIPKSVTRIGTAAFQDSELTTVSFRDSTKKCVIDPFAFYDCANLTSVSFSDKTEYEIKTGAFAVSHTTLNDKLETFKFPANIVKFLDSGKDCLTSGDIDTKSDYIVAGRQHLKNVILPAKLAGRIPNNMIRDCVNLESFIFPESAHSAWFGNYSPENSTDYNSFGGDTFTLFNDIINDDFFVEGPGFSDTLNRELAIPRILTWKSINANGHNIPYKYTISEKDISTGETITNTYCEVGTSSLAEQIQTIKVINNTSNAILQKYANNSLVNATPNIFTLVIPDEIAGYHVVAIANDCLDQTMKDKIKKLIICDGSVEEIGESAFANAKELSLVFLGNSVRFIGSKAFANCPNLNDVYFSQTDFQGSNPQYDVLSIPKYDAFATGSLKLTIHGAISPDYRPFQIAMNMDNDDGYFGLLRGCQICYKTDDFIDFDGNTSYGGIGYDKYGLTVIRDRVAEDGNERGLITLIDYTHFEEIDSVHDKVRQRMEDYYKANGKSSGFVYSIVEKFLEVNNLQTPYETYRLGDTLSMDVEEGDIVEQTINMVIPEGIDSIDAKSYFESHKAANQSDINAYFRKTYTDDGNGTFADDIIKSTINKWYSALQDAGFLSIENLRQFYADSENPKSSITGLPDKYRDEKTVPGLFSGFFNESRNPANAYNIDSTNMLIGYTYDGVEYKEDTITGNDILTTINMQSIKNLPNYAFMDCDNLIEAFVGTNLNKIGSLPFKGCKQMKNIDIAEGNRYFYFDDMVLFENKDGNPEGYATIRECLEGVGITKSIEDSRINAMSVGAFSDCENLYALDLSKTSIESIPRLAFNGCDGINQINLPETISEILPESFTDIDTSKGGKKIITIDVPNPDCRIDGAITDADDEVSFVIYGDRLNSKGKDSQLVKFETAFNANHTKAEAVVKQRDVTYMVTLADDFKVNGQIVHNEFGTFKVGRGEKLSQPEYSIFFKQGDDHDGYVLDYWSCILSDGTTLNSVDGSLFEYEVMSDMVIMAHYKEDPDSVQSDNKKYLLTIKGDATATSSKDRVSGDAIEVTSGATVILQYNSDSKYYFRAWASDDITIDDLFSTMIYFIMPKQDVTITALTAGEIGGSAGDNPSQEPSSQNPSTQEPSTQNPSSQEPTTQNPSSDNSNGDNKTKYNVTVNYGSGTGSYAAGEIVQITAFAPDSTSKVFSKWTSANSNVGFANPSSATTSFVMPSSEVVVTANYKSRVLSDDEDDDDRELTNRRPSSNTVSTETKNPSNASSGSNSTSDKNKVNTNDKLVIDKNGVSNRDLGTANVEGSTDNFIVKITESDEAANAAKEALRNRFGSLDGIVYFPMDISLYDATGKNKIKDTYGLNVTVQMPIPDVLIKYGGNVRVGAADNGYLSELNTRFTTIDGIACMSFVPPHFSPYVMYVDTNNLKAGTMFDKTPQTGDPIHPKWFLAGGFACLSILLFVTGDKKKKFSLA